MKQRITLILFVITSFFQNVIAQSNSINLNDVDRIILNATTIENSNVPNDAKQILQSKLQQIATTNSLSGNSYNPRYIITAKANVLSKNVVAGPPQSIALNVEFVFFIGDAIDNIIYSTTNKTFKAVGSNENKAFIEAINQINTKDEIFKPLIEEGKNKIVNWYSTQCDFIIKNAETLATQEKYQEAIYTLISVPQVCKDCYTKCQDANKPIYIAYQNKECNKKLNEAKQKWSAEPTQKTAKVVATLLSLIYPDAPCYNEAEKLAEEVKKKIEDTEKKEWEFKMKKYNDNIEMEKQKLEIYKSVATEYAKRQPQTIIYNRINW